ncbi:MAG: hypothetical protein ACTSRE_10425 [Promethearchaeota archaeon]
MDIGTKTHNSTIKGRDEEVPREIDFEYVLNVFQTQYQSIEKSSRDVLTGTNTIQTIRFLLNEYTSSRLIHYDRLNSFLLHVPSISDICAEALRKDSIIQILSDDAQIKDFESRKDELFAPVVAQSTLFLLKELLKHPIKKTRVLNEHFPPIRDLLHEFVDKINPHKKENFKWYYHPSNLKNIALFLDKNPELDITQVFPLFYENDEFYIEYTDWLEQFQDSSKHAYDERQGFSTSDLEINRDNLNFLENFLHMYLREPKIPADIDAEIVEFLPKILHIEIIREIVSFYENKLPKCFPAGSNIYERLRGGIAAFRCILEEYYGQNFVSIGYLEFWNRLKKEGVPDKFIDSFILDVTSSHKKIKDYSYDVFWKKPFLRIKTGGKKPTDQIYFSYVQILDGFFHFLSSNMKSYIMASSRGRGFEELVAEKIIKKLGIVPQKIVVHDPAKTDNDEDFRSVMEQNELITPSGQKIRICKVVPDLKSPKLKLGRNFRWREIDLAFVYNTTLYILECKNHLFSDFADFEPIILKRNLMAYSNSYGKRKLCKDERVRHSLNIMGQLKYKKVRFMIISGEECPFEFMLSYNQFCEFIQNFEKVDQKMNDIDKSYVSKTLFSEDSQKKVWFEDIGDDLVEEKLSTISGLTLGGDQNSNSSSNLKLMSKSKLGQDFSEFLVNKIKANEKVEASAFKDFFYTKSAHCKASIIPMLKTTHKLQNLLLSVYKFSFKFKDVEDNTFAIPAACLRYCIDVIQLHFGSKTDHWMVGTIIHNLPGSFRNVIVGGRGMGRYFSADSIDLYNKIILDFEKNFRPLKIHPPSKEEIKAELVGFLEKYSLSEAKTKKINMFIEKW